LVLIVTNSSDPTADFFIANLRANKQPYFRFDTDKFLTSYGIQYSHSKRRSCVSLTNTNTSEKVLSDDVSGIWYRRPVDPQLNIDDAKDELGRQLSQEARCEYEWILRSLDGVKWVSRPERLRFAEDRLVQLRIAADVGFSVPDTIITNSESEARQFLSLHPRVCNKPLLIGQMEIGEDLYLYYNSMVSEKDNDPSSTL
jgi:glutathione synthase/RimK-type ligase-like ATP-grasp enzyme